MDIDSLDENDGVKLYAKRKGKAKQEKLRAPLRSIDCTCVKGDDGSPMIQCSECKIWYHFTCVDLSEPEAEEINIYICPTCTTSTGRRSTMNWEGDAANEEYVDDEVTITARRKAALSKSRDGKRVSEMAEESEESSSSEDEYIDVKREHVEQSKLVSKRTSNASDSDSEDHNRKRRFTRKVSASPVTSVQHSTLKRKAAPHSNPVQASPAHKRKRSTESHGHGSTAADDPARKYCLGKLEELFKDVFLRYPHIRTQSESSAAGQPMDVTEDSNETAKLVPKDPELLTEEEKETVLNRARQFANELESSVFEIYAEPDKNGNPHAGGKYKERFRMLQFNLSKVDRVIIHQRITSGNISAKEISLMSSTDLADEETKQSIKLAEKEALEHSILLKSSAPRAKITHKGLQDIEDVNGEVATAQQIERLKEREQEEDERRERERMARLRTVQRQRTASISVPPESPIVPSGEYQWGAPPPVPPHAISPTAAESEENQGQSLRPSLFLQTSEVNNVEPELNLDDLINIDGEQESPRPSPIQESTSGTSTDTKLESLLSTHPSPIVSTPTGISPFASRPERMRGASFDLSSIWNAPKDEASTSESAQKAISVPAAAPSGESPTEGSDKDDAMELESVEANDQDFDMFLEDNQVESPSDDLIVTPIPSLQDVESLPQVWTGKLAMPLDSSMPQETYLIARQVAGRGIPPESPLWRTLFPSDQLRIEGRVPVDNSVKYLMQMRLNASKELYAAAFVPASAANAEDFKTFCNFLKSKSRHGLVFPWGNRPKDYHPGRELYMIPLLQSEPLPEFVELLDGLKLPTTRTKDYLLGIWILNRGKLAVLPNSTTTQAPPKQTPPPASMPPSQLPPPVSMPPVQPPQHIPRIPVIPPPMFNTPPPHVPQNLPIPTPPLSIPQTIPGMPAIAPAALAAEVASLTPEQLQEVLRTLAATTQIPLPPPTGHIPQPPSQPPFSQNRPPFPPHAPPHIPPGSQSTQPWMHHTPPPPPPPGQYPVNYPPPNAPYQQPPRGSNSPAPALYDRHDYDHDYRSGPHYSHGGRGGHDDRGWRGNQSNRGRGRGRGDGYDRDYNGRRSSDSGWPRRRHDNQGGPW
ncbi:Transcription factor bye1 [Psilocybe cubensis]|uniref:Transcription factor bye1 n=1 Tax=Psilocybe cubensis TaxID=181762 RepID=A0ACB8GUG2_PSICU|nr:Transcription factor bye1 [Psilocybe cubensis]KAH9479373.1 Transcription factor bye1 [Psilocybe cubensis]